MINKETLKRSIIVVIIFVLLFGFAVFSQNIDHWTGMDKNTSVSQSTQKQDVPTKSEQTPATQDLIVITNVKTFHENGYWHITYDVINNSKLTLSYGDGVMYFRDNNGNQVGSEDLVFSNILSGGKNTEELYISKNKFTSFKDYIVEIKNTRFN